MENLFLILLETSIYYNCVQVEFFFGIILNFSTTETGDEPGCALTLEEYV
jgi:hypothetical protein